MKKLLLLLLLLIALNSYSQNFENSNFSYYNEEVSFDLKVGEYFGKNIFTNMIATGRQTHFDLICYSVIKNNILCVYYQNTREGGFFRNENEIDLTTPIITVFLKDKKYYLKWHQIFKHYGTKVVKKQSLKVFK